MIILYINDACAKGCSFCFVPDGVKQKSREMSLEHIEQMVDKLDLKHVQIQGGEPTQHSKFLKIIQMLAAKGVTFNMLSNILFSERMCNELISYIHLGVCKNISPNASELDEKPRQLKLWKKNYLKLHEAFGNSAESMNLMWTIPKGLRKDKKRDCLEYIEWLRNEIPNNFKSLRIGLDLCGTYIINNRELGRILDNIDLLGKRYNFSFYTDCQCPPCINEPGELRPWHSLQNDYISCAADHGTNKGVEVNPDMSTTHCFQSQGEIGMPYIVPNILEHQYGGGDRVRQLQKIATKKYIETDAKINLPQACKECDYFPLVCNGICMGCKVGEHDNRNVARRDLNFTVEQASTKPAKYVPPASIKKSPIPAI